MKIVKLSNSIDIAKVDDIHFDYLSKYVWRKNAQGYAVRRFYIGRGKTRIAKDVRMHRQIMGDPLGLEIDHIDGDGLNNQTSNLRVATHKQNLANRTKQVNNTSGYKGVSWSRQNKKWWANICVNGKTISIGFFDDILAAARAYNEAAIKYQGKFARINTL